jgi:hypothetical protein
MEAIAGHSLQTAASTVVMSAKRENFETATATNSCADDDELNVGNADYLLPNSTESCSHGSFAVGVAFSPGYLISTHNGVDMCKLVAQHFNWLTPGLFPIRYCVTFVHN